MNFVELEPPISEDPPSLAHRLSDWVLKHAIRYVTLVCKLIAMVAPIVIGFAWDDLSFWGRWGLILLAVASVAGEWYVSSQSHKTLEGERNAARRLADQRFIEGREALYIFTDEVVEPTLEHLRRKINEVTSARMSDSRLESLRTEILHAARVFLSGDSVNVRANYYRLVRGASGQWELRRQDQTSGNARRSFKMTSGGGLAEAEARTTIENLLALRKTSCLDIQADGAALGIDPSQERGYVGFISVPVGKESPPYGMLSVNTTTPGQLTPEDVSLVSSMADFMAVTEALSRDRKDERAASNLGVAPVGESESSDMMEAREVGTQ